MVDERRRREDEVDEDEYDDDYDDDYDDEADYADDEVDEPEPEPEPERKPKRRRGVSRREAARREVKQERENQRERERQEYQAPLRERRPRPQPQPQPRVANTRTAKSGDWKERLPLPLAAAALLLAAVGLMIAIGASGETVDEQARKDVEVLTEELAKQTAEFAEYKAEREAADAEAAALVSERLDALTEDVERNLPAALGKQLSDTLAPVAASMAGLDSVVQELVNDAGGAVRLAQYLTVNGLMEGYNSEGIRQEMGLHQWPVSERGLIHELRNAPAAQ